MESLFFLWQINCASRLQSIWGACGCDLQAAVVVPPPDLAPACLVRSPNLFFHTNPYRDGDLLSANAVALRIKTSFALSQRELMALEHHLALNHGSAHV
jgi:hypothetical protein